MVTLPGTGDGRETFPWPKRIIGKPCQRRGCTLHLAKKTNPSGIDGHKIAQAGKNVTPDF
jgi:hypothetical protein